MSKILIVNKVLSVSKILIVNISSPRKADLHAAINCWGLIDAVVLVSE